MPAAARTGPSLPLLLACAIPMVVVLALLPPFIGLYQTELLIYGLTFAIAALGFNLLLGSTGLKLGNDLQDRPPAERMGFGRRQRKMRPWLERHAHVSKNSFGLA